MRATQAGKARTPLTLTELAADYNVLPDTVAHTAGRDDDADDHEVSTLHEKLPAAMKLTAPELPNTVVEHLQSAIETHESSWRKALEAAESEWKTAKAEALTRAKARHEAAFREERRKWDNERAQLVARIDEAATTGNIHANALQSRLDAVTASNVELQQRLDKVMAEYITPEEHNNSLVVLEIKLASREMLHKEELVKLKAGWEAELLRVKADGADVAEKITAAVRTAEVEHEGKLASEISRVQDVFASQWRDREDGFRRQWQEREEEFKTQLEGVQAQLREEQEAHAVTMATLERTRATLDGTKKNLEQLKAKIQSVADNAGYSASEFINDADGFNGAVGDSSPSTKRTRRDTGMPRAQSFKRRDSWSTAKQAFQRSLSLSNIMNAMAAGSDESSNLDNLLSSKSGVQLADGAAAQRVANVEDARLQEVASDKAAAASGLVADLLIDETGTDISPALSVAQKLRIPSPDGSAKAAAAPFLLSARTQQLLFSPEIASQTILERDEESDDDTSIVDGVPRLHAPSVSAGSPVFDGDATTLAQNAEEALTDLEKLAAIPVEMDDAAMQAPIVVQLQPAPPPQVQTTNPDEDFIPVDSPRSETEPGLPPSDEHAQVTEQLNAHIDDLVQQYEAEAELCSALTSEVSRLTDLSASLLRDNQELHVQLSRAQVDNNSLHDAEDASGRTALLEEEIRIANSAIDDLRAQLDAAKRTANELQDYADKSVSMREQLASVLLAFAWMECHPHPDRVSRPEAVIAEFTNVVFTKFPLASMTVPHLPHTNSVIVPVSTPSAGVINAAREAGLASLALDDSAISGDIPIRYGDLTRALAKLYPLATVDGHASQEVPAESAAQLDELLRKVREQAAAAAAQVGHSAPTQILLTPSVSSVATLPSVQAFPKSVFDFPQKLSAVTAKAAALNSAASSNLADALMVNLWRENYAGLLALLATSATTTANSVSPISTAQALVHFLRAVSRAVGLDAERVLAVLTEGLQLVLHNETAVPTSNDSTLESGAGAMPLPERMSPRAKHLAHARMPSQDPTWVANLQSTISALTQQAGEAHREQGHTLAALSLARETIAALSLELATAQAISAAVHKENAELLAGMQNAEQVVQTLLPRIEAASHQIMMLAAENESQRQQHEADRASWAVSLADASSAAFALRNEILRVEHQAREHNDDVVPRSRYSALEERGKEIEADFKRREDEWRQRESSLLEKLAALSHEAGQASAVAMKDRIDEDKWNKELQCRDMELDGLRKNLQDCQDLLAQRESELNALATRQTSDIAQLTHVTQELHQLKQAVIVAQEKQLATEEEGTQLTSEDPAAHRSPRRAAPTIPPPGPSSFEGTYSNLEQARLHLLHEANQLPAEWEASLYTPGIWGPAAGPATPREKLQGSLVGANSQMSFSRYYNNDYSGASRPVSSAYQSMPPSPAYVSPSWKAGSPSFGARTAAGTNVGAVLATSIKHEAVHRRR